MLFYFWQIFSNIIILKVLFATCMAVASAIQLVSYQNGALAPAKTPEVIAAELAHFAEHGIAAPAIYTGYPTWGYTGLVAHPNGAVVPVESPEVAAARAAHLAAHAAA